VHAVTRGTEDQAGFGPAQAGQCRDDSRRESAAPGEVHLRRQRFDQSIQYLFLHVVAGHAGSV
jgi:hypothetical protein